MKSNITLAIILVLSLALNFFLINRKNKTSDDTFIQPKIITFVDTTTYLNIKDSTIVRYDTTELRTVTNDTTSVIIPIMQKEFVTDNYRAYISGYKPNLDSLFFFVKPEPIKIKIPKQKRWAFGIQAGATIGPKGINPYIGLGVTYVIFSL